MIYKNYPWKKKRKVKKNKNLEKNYVWKDFKKILRQGIDLDQT
jgi:hypothetical protein